MSVLPLAVVSLALVGCSSTAARRPSAPVLPDPVMSRGPCPTITDRATFDAAVAKYYEADMRKAGLDAELAARPLTTLVPFSEMEHHIATVRDGRCERIQYRVGDLRVTGFIVYPPPSPGPVPVILWLRGGNREFGAIEPVTLLNLRRLADAGFVVLATQYRGVDGGQGAEQFGGADVEDVKALVDVARALPSADASRLYLIGGSRGAMEGLVALRAGLPARAAVFRGGLYDLHASLAERPDLAQAWREVIPHFDSEQRTAELDRRSAVQWAGELRTPLLLLHGRQDWRASFAQAEHLDRVLGTRAAIDHRLLVYERDEHQLALHRDEWLAASIDWFRTH